MGWLRRKKVEIEKAEIVVSPPFCINCRWIRYNNFFQDEKRLTYARCANPKSRTNGPLFLVTGNPDHKDMHFCTTERGSRVSGDCGPQGRYFEPMFIDLEAVHVETDPMPFSAKIGNKVLDSR
jgi:hypothetical protein